MKELGKSRISTKQIKSALLEFHRKRGYKIFDSFPLVSQDPTVMFVNATITPFKHYFIYEERPDNFAFIQRCFRMGGASELKLAGCNPYYHTFFEMFGSGTFFANYQEAIIYLLELLDSLTLEREKTYFAVPDKKNFRNNLITNGVNPSRIFILKEKDIFWRNWNFGKIGPVGKGLTIIYSRSQEKISSLEQIIKGSDDFIELGNLIDIYGQKTKDSKIISVKNPGFEFAVGIERLAAAIQNCNNYQIDTILPLSQFISSFFQERECFPSEAKIRIFTDHLRAICVLIDEGLMPSNKLHGYVLRKLIRNTLKDYWIAFNQISSMEQLLKEFCYQFNQCSEEKISCQKVTLLINQETKKFLIAIEKAKKVLKKNPHIPPAVLSNTYGLPRDLISIIVENEKQK